MTQYACPRCGHPVMLLEVNSRHFKYKIVCLDCCFYDWVDKLEELKEIKDDGKHS